MPSTTTSVRLPHGLKQRLDARSRRLKVGRNRIVVEALEAFLSVETSRAQANEARRQSLLASGITDDGWLAAAEGDAWQT